MSVILTSAKRAVQQKKPKKRRSFQGMPSIPMEQRPPLSDGDVSVWFWDLDGLATTVFFYKRNQEVWCNGYRMETYDGFIEPLMSAAHGSQAQNGPGDAIDFTIFVAETQMSYQARITRLPAHLVNGVSTHRLTVDDWLIPEHCTYDYSTYDQYLSVTNGDGFDPDIDDVYLNSKPLYYDDDN